MLIIASMNTGLALFCLGHGPYYLIEKLFIASFALPVLCVHHAVLMLRSVEPDNKIDAEDDAGASQISAI